jgi:hypothetical protein
LNRENAGVLVPPRPNLGPEPWSEVSTRRDLPWIIGSLAAGLLLCICWFVIRRRGRRRRAIPPLVQHVIGIDDPAAQLVNLAGQVREMLATRFGPSIRARTTEELSADPAIKEALGGDRLESLIRLLRAADLWKFASPPDNGQTESLLEELPHWSTWQRTLLSQRPSKG